MGYMDQEDARNLPYSMGLTRAANQQAMTHTPLKKPWQYGSIIPGIATAAAAPLANVVQPAAPKKTSTPDAPPAQPQWQSGYDLPQGQAAPASPSAAPTPSLAARAVPSADNQPSVGAGTLGGDPNRLAQIKAEYAGMQDRERADAVQNQQMALWDRARQDRLFATPQAYEIDELKRRAQMAQVDPMAARFMDRKQLRAAMANAGMAQEAYGDAAKMRAGMMAGMPVPNVVGDREQAIRGLSEQAQMRNREALTQAQVPQIGSETALNQARVPLLGAEGRLMDSRTELNKNESGMYPLRQKLFDQQLEGGQYALQDRATRASALAQLYDPKTPEDTRRALRESILAEHGKTQHDVGRYRTRDTFNEAGLRTGQEIFDSTTGLPAQNAAPKINEPLPNHVAALKAKKVTPAQFDEIYGVGASKKFQ